MKQRRKRDRRLVGRIFVESTLTQGTPQEGATTIYSHRISAENIVEIPRDVTIHSSCPDGNALIGEQPAAVWAHEFKSLLGRHPGREVSLSCPAPTAPLMRVQTGRMSVWDDLSEGWSDNLIEPIIELKLT